MIRKCITKINSFIQWTKKCYFTHIFIILSIPLNLACLLFILLSPTADSINEWNEAMVITGFISYFYQIANIIITIAITILIRVFLYFLGKKLVIHKFFLENPGYNIFYIASWILIALPILCLILASISENI